MMHRLQRRRYFTAVCGSLSCIVWTSTRSCFSGRPAYMQLHAAYFMMHNISQQGGCAGRSEFLPGEETSFSRESDEVQLRAELECLTKRLDIAHEVIRELLGLVDKKRYSSELAALDKNFVGGVGLVVTSTAAELEKALQTPGSRIILAENHHYVLGTRGPIVISHTNISIWGNKSTIEGSIQLSHHATLDACDVTFKGLKDTSDEYDEDGVDWKSTSMLPCIEATQRSRVYLHNCSLIGGRDGVYLGIESKAQLKNVYISDCARGIYEGVGCRVYLSECMMAGNFFHLVLLGRGRKATAAALSATNSSDETNEEVGISVRFLDTSDVGKKRTRADIALDHNPITDTYAEFIHRGKKIELPQKLSTCSLSDPVY
ncbi:hypothetical protein TraAM80_08119 [Trypanosoma rangeli]|uniref:Right handed beta helix domain-containing protein n=1 Tax=Trypanosoma rangeli TaxID=5698 RepID=A0A3R7NAP5_TRYRA|nr:uncharacterized protein TraAM80_08119 [Trypanosoma rangeli]RNE99645.1 hypothetical protein TraAM80_08119 [Trypanosoma rangeli]|eukprot:RNE99645.1 hypothetical protein TraAM80_08119 [Trypanosoma rangeli]